MNEPEIQVKMLQMRRELRQIHSELRTVSQAPIDETQRQHTKLALISIERTMRELAEAVWPDYMAN